MGLINIDGILLKKMIIAGANRLNENKQLLDSLNVFPVPDGDTGTNMSLTVFAAAIEVEKLNTPNIYDVAKVASSGSLRGARGNSGVIVSQLFRGFAKGLENISVANADDIANALMVAQETAYKAVMKPKEGTILTVAKEVALKATEISFDSDDIKENLIEIHEYGLEILGKTQFMLPELKQAGVVDAGGMGFLFFLEGALAALDIKGDIKINQQSNGSVNNNNNVFNNIKTEDIKFAYCTELIINIEKQSDNHEEILKNYLQTIGDSIVVVVDDGIVKIHVHTNNPGKVLEKGVIIGSLADIKIENMKQQHTNKLNFTEDTKPEAKTEEKELGFVVASMGAGLKELFIKLGADVVIEGGQTMNPSTEDILQAVEKVNAKNVIVLPNNKNIVLAAEQATYLSENKKIFVIPTKTIPQGIAALINYIQIDSVEDNINCMSEALDNLRTGQVTYAVRDTVFNDKKISEGDILCMLESDIELVSKDLQQGTKQLIDRMIKDGSEFISIYYGADTTEEMANELLSYINKKYPDCEVEVYEGKQPLYYYFISME